MTIAEIMKQAEELSPQERKELVKLLIDSLDVGLTSSRKQHPDFSSTVLTGSDIATMLNDMEPIELLDSEISDPVEWVKTQRRKEAERLKPYWNTET